MVIDVFEIKDHHILAQFTPKKYIFEGTASIISNDLPFIEEPDSNGTL
jgi:hypothetical protein